MVFLGCVSYDPPSEDNHLHGCQGNHNCSGTQENGPGNHKEATWGHEVLQGWPGTFTSTLTIILTKYFLQDCAITPGSLLKVGVQRIYWLNANECSTSI